MGGLESHVAEWAHAWVAAGYGDVCIMTGSPGQTALHWEPEKGIVVYSFPTWEIIPGYPVPKVWTAGFRRVRRAGRERKPDMIHTHTRFFLTSIIGGLFAKVSRKPWIHIEHGVEYVKLRSRLLTQCAWLFDQICGRWVFCSATMVIGISDGCKRFIQRFTRRDVPVIRRGMALDIALLDEVWKKKGERMSGRGAPEGMGSGEEAVLPHQREYIIGFVGRLVALKGVDLLIRAIAGLRVAGYTVSCQIVGDGDARQSLEKLVDDLGLGDVVRFRGAMAREAVVRDFLPQVDIIVNPSYQEGLPTSVLEGLLTGCVVVATDVGGTPEISEEADLVLVKPGNVDGLQKGLERALETYDESVGKSRLEVRRKFSWERAMGEYKRAFEK